MDTNEQTMPTKYDPSAIEKGRYDFWLKGKYFEAGGDQTKQPYSVVIPPPNVTGRSHPDMRGIRRRKISLRV